VVSCVLKHDVTCESCVKSLCASDCDTDQVDETLAQLVRLKEYKDGCLVLTSKTVFDAITAAEVVFRRLQKVLLAYKGNVTDMIVNKISDECQDIVLPTCHNGKQKLIKRYVRARVQFFARKQAKQREGLLKQSSGHEMSSKSMQMRKSVSKIK